MVELRPHREIAPVGRSRDEARASYDRLAPFYDVIASPFEGIHRHRMVEMLGATRGESVLDVGFGTGAVVTELAGEVGKTGMVAGIDISPEMKRVADKKIDRFGLEDRTDLRVGDACDLPFEDDSFDAVCASFTLELFELGEMHRVLEEWRRVLVEDGRVAVAALSTHERTMASRIYELLHRLFPSVLDCRPIPVEDILEEAGFSVREVVHAKMVRIPVAIVGAGC